MIYDDPRLELAKEWLRKNRESDTPHVFYSEYRGIPTFRFTADDGSSALIGYMLDDYLEEEVYDSPYRFLETCLLTSSKLKILVPLEVEL